MSWIWMCHEPRATSYKLRVLSYEIKSCKLRASRCELQATSENLRLKLRMRRLMTEWYCIWTVVRYYGTQLYRIRYIEKAVPWQIYTGWLYSTGAVPCYHQPVHARSLSSFYWARLFHDFVHSTGKFNSIVVKTLKAETGFMLLSWWRMKQLFNF
jgi:hypothetical protein